MGEGVGGGGRVGPGVFHLWWLGFGCGCGTVGGGGLVGSVVQLLGCKDQGDAGYRRVREKARKLDGSRQWPSCGAAAAAPGADCWSEVLKWGWMRQRANGRSEQLGARLRYVPCQGVALSPSGLLISVGLTTASQACRPCRVAPDINNYNLYTLGIRRREDKKNPALHWLPRGGIATYGSNQCLWISSPHPSRTQHSTTPSPSLPNARLENTASNSPCPLPNSSTHFPHQPTQSDHHPAYCSRRSYRSGS